MLCRGRGSKVRSRTPLSPWLALLASMLAPAAAHAGPGSGPLINFGQSILDFLTGPLAYVVFGVGICIAAISLVMGSREGIQKAVYAVVGGGLLFGVHAVIDFVQSAAR
jgi:type IV secretory pathway VirB2 component (pilin)